MKHKHLITSILLLLATLGAYNLYIIPQIGDHPEKLWLHRTNSLEKMYEKEKRFPNYEVDLVFRNNGTFDVTHDADTSFHLSLEAYLPDAAMDDDSLWLDIKNLTPENAGRILKKLNELCDKYHINKDQLIIESRNERALSQFTADSFYTSYYVDFEKPSQLNDKEIAHCIDSLQHIIDRNQIRAISFPGWWYGEINEHLNRPIDLLTWTHRTTEYELLTNHRYKQMLRDPQVKVILVKSKGKYHR